MNSIPGITGTEFFPADPSQAVNAPEAQNTESFSDYYEEALSAVTEDTGAGGRRVPETGGPSVFNGYMSESTRDALINEMLTSGSGAASSVYSSLPGLGIENALLSSAASGEIDDKQLALFMLCMMISMAGEDSDKSMLYNVMAALMGGLSGSGGVAYSGPAPVFSPAIGWDGSVKSMPSPAVSVNGAAVIPANPWKPAIPAKVSSEGNRSPGLLRSVIDQFDVENSPRYEPYRNGSSATYCNIFVWDVTSALGCEIPHFVDYRTGEPLKYPDITNAYELNANDIQDWLLNVGAQYGWREVSPEQAQMYANRGYPAVASWKTVGAAGHVQIVCPSADGDYNPSLGPAVAQAGSKLSKYEYQINLYGPGQISNVRYFVHD